MKTINISQFKTHISSVLRSVRDGDEVVILDRDVPVAHVTKYREQEETVTVRRPEMQLELRRLGIRVEVDPLVVLMEDRSGR